MRVSKDKKNTLTLAAFALVILLLVVLTGCSGTAATSTAAGGTTVVTTTAVTTVTTAATTTTTTTTTAANPRPSNPDMILATTTSTQDSGLLDALLPVFEAQTGYNVKTIAVGSGAAMTLGEKGEADVLLVHSPAAEAAFMENKHGIDRALVMHNDFIVVGPPADPAGIKGQASATEALKMIAAAQAIFISRGDKSGTDALEKKLWTATGITQVGQSWYQESGQGMGASLIIATEKSAYTITDRATYLANRSNLDLDILVEGDPGLLNVYHVILVDPAKSTLINAAGAQAFFDFMIAPETQAIIAEFGKEKFGMPLFFPDAGKTDAEMGLP